MAPARAAASGRCSPPTGLLFALTSLNGFAAPLAFTLGRVLYAAVMFALVYVFLCFPGDRLGLARATGASSPAWPWSTVVVWVVVLALAVRLPTTGPFSECAAACPHNALRVVDGAAEAGRVAGVVANAVTVASFLAVTVLLPVRLRGTGRAGRRTLAPLFAAMCALLVALAAYTIAREAFDARPAVLSAAVAAAILLIPVAIVAGQVRGRLFAARRLGSLVSRRRRHPGDRPGRGAARRRGAGRSHADPRPLGRLRRALPRPRRRARGGGRAHDAGARSRRRAPTLSSPTTRPSTRRPTSCAAWRRARSSCSTTPAWPRSAASWPTRCARRARAWRRPPTTSVSASSATSTTASRRA